MSYVYLQKDQRVDIPRTPGHRGKIILKILSGITELEDLDNNNGTVEEESKSSAADMEKYIQNLGNTWFIRELDRTPLQREAMLGLLNIYRERISSTDAAVNRYNEVLLSDYMSRS